MTGVLSFCLVDVAMVTLVAQQAPAWHLAVVVARAGCLDQASN